jgi:putative protease
MEVEIGKVTHYFNHLNVAVLKLTDSLKIGDTIHILGHLTDVTERVTSMQINHQTVVWVKPGDDVAVKVYEPVREHDIVYRIVEEAPEPHLAC